MKIECTEKEKEFLILAIANTCLRTFDKARYGITCPCTDCSKCVERRVEWTINSSKEDV